MVSKLGYKPDKPETRKWLDEAWEAVKSVDYQVSLRWVFYRLLQKGYFKSKRDYKDKFSKIMSSVRHGEYENWRPDTLADETRTAIYQGFGALTEDDVSYTAFRPLDKFKDQKNIVMVAYEANAMSAQFKKYVEHQPLFPCGGQPSIPYKYEIAKAYENACERYEDAKNLILLYFGDRDKAGEKIRDVVFEHVGKWCGYDIEMISCGLTSEQAKTMNLPENPEKPETYQWEALNDEQARNIILAYLYKYVDKDKLNANIKRENELKEKLK